MKKSGWTKNASLLFCTALVAHSFIFFAWAKHCTGEPLAYEAPQVFDAAKILPPDLLSGPNFMVGDEVRNDGFLNHYVLKSSYEDYIAVSTFELHKRIHEIKAITEMKKIDTSSTIKASIVDSGEKAVKGVSNLILNPLNSVEGAAKGIGSVFGRVKETVSSTPSQTEDTRLQQLIGFSKSKRNIANQLGVDVYSTNRTLQAELDRLAWADYSGGIGVGTALAAVPGGAGAFLSMSGGTRLLNEAINLTPPTELRKQNRDKLINMGMNSDTVALFINNAVFSPRMQTWLTAALETLEGASNRELFLKVALQAYDRTTALVITQMGLMFAGYHSKVEPVERMYPVSRVLYAKDKKGTIVLALPVDHILWTDRLERAVAEIMEKKDGKSYELWAARRISQQATDQLTRAGWIIHSDVWEMVKKNLEVKTQ
jgi:hypothetical protein